MARTSCLQPFELLVADVPEDSATGTCTHLCEGWDEARRSSGCKEGARTCSEPPHMYTRRRTRHTKRTKHTHTQPLLHPLPPLAGLFRDAGDAGSLRWSLLDGCCSTLPPAATSLLGEGVECEVRTRLRTPAPLPPAASAAPLHPCTPATCNQHSPAPLHSCHPLPALLHAKGGGLQVAEEEVESLNAAALHPPAPSKQVFDCDSAPGLPSCQCVCILPKARSGGWRRGRFVGALDVQGMRGTYGPSILLLPLNSSCQVLQRVASMGRWASHWVMGLSGYWPEAPAHMSL